MVQTIFITALTLVSALALALVYGLGGWYALQGTLERRCGRHAGPADHPAVRPAHRPGQSARVEVMSALVSFERVFEILDLKPLITEAGAPRDAAGRAGLGRVRRRDASRYPSADKVSLASLEEVAVLDTRGGVEVIHDVSFRGASRARWSPWSAPRGRASRPSRSCWPGSTTSTPARSGSAASTSAT